MTPQYRYARPYGTRLLSVRVLVGVIPIMAAGVPVGVVVGVTSPCSSSPRSPRSVGCCSKTGSRCCSSAAGLAWVTTRSMFALQATGEAHAAQLRLVDRQKAGLTVRMVCHECGAEQATAGDASSARRDRRCV